MIEVKDKYNIELWIFGSILNKSNPRDIDILMLYPMNTEKISDIYVYRNSLVNSLENNFGIEVDLTLLSFEEERSIGFIKKEKCLYIG